MPSTGKVTLRVSGSAADASVDTVSTYIEGTYEGSR
jgi:hypothetical protein